MSSIIGAVRHSALPLAPAKPARDYQIKAVDLLRATGSLLLTDAVGLGKTFTGLLSTVHADALPMVVVPPTHLPGRWMIEAAEAFPWLRVETARKSTPPDSWAPADLPDVLIVPYSRLGGWSAHLKGHVSTVVFDEVQDLRHGVSTVKGSAAAALCMDATYVLGLTASPIYNYGGEIWNIIDILAPGRLGTKEEFTREWGHSYSNGQIHVANPAALGSYLREQGLMFGRSRQDVGRELPATIKVPHVIEADTSALDAIKGDATAMAKLILSDTATSQERWQAAGDFDWRLRQATGIAKAPYVAEFVRLLLESEEKVVLAGWHRAVYDIWMDALAPFKPVLYTGSETPAGKARAEEAFVNGDSRVFILSLRSGAGIDGLQKAAKVVAFGELDWSPQVHSQLIGRLERDGMGDDPVVAYYLNSTEGSDPAVLGALQVKRLQGEPLISPDGRLFPQAAPDRSRARLLAEAYLASTSKV